MFAEIGPWLGMPFLTRDSKFILPYLVAEVAASLHKTVSLRFFQDLGYFVSKRLIRNIYGAGSQIKKFSTSSHS